MRTGLEPATPGVTGRYSNQLNYRTNCSDFVRFPLTRMQRYAFFRNLQIFFEVFSIFLGFDLLKVATAGITLAVAWCSESENSIFRKSATTLFYFNYSFLFFYLRFLHFGELYAEDSVFCSCLDVIFFYIVGEDQCLMKF